MATITFDGAAKTITIGYDGPTTGVTAAALYSAWKDWVVAGNAQFQPAFGESVGGNELGGGVFLSGYFFLRNDLGWRIVPANGFDHELQISGDLYPQDPGQAFVVPPAGDFTVLVTFQRSAASYLTVTGGGDPEAVADAVWDRAMSGHGVAGSFGKRLRELLPTLWGVR